MNKSNGIFIKTLSIAFLFCGACDNSTESNGLKNKLYIQINDKNGNYVANVGLHFISDTLRHLPYNIFLVQESKSIESIDSNINIPNAYELYQNYPNPFDPFTTINFSLPSSGEASLKIVNRIDSTIVKTLLDRNLPAGLHQVHWDGTNDSGQNVTNNLYLCQLITDEFKETMSLFLYRMYPNDIKTLGCISLWNSDSKGKIEMEYDIFPLNEEYTIVTESNVVLGTSTIPDTLQLVFIKDGFKTYSTSVSLDTSIPLELSISLEEDE
ncbi:MAG: hypothetical protein HQ562_07640 [Candidatus Marinimicrobia bacterium]|nr:hypothetical protein [Candidatus Neomarinimicrobiota bacterium]